MDDRKRLEWLMRNRAKPARMTPANAAITALVEKVWANDVEPAEEAASALAEVVDDEFRRHCRVAKWQAGWLRIEVDEFSMMPLLRHQWAGPIRAAWPALGLKALKRISFEHGRSGVPIGC